MEKSITKKAYAKVNLSLDIVGRREDGYHLVRMVMQSLDIADELDFERLETPVIEVLLNGETGQVSETGSDAKDSGDKNLGRVPLDEDNLIYKVAKLMLEQYVWKRNPDAGVRITLTKNIPIAAGMAGGSSDAAATFRGMNELFELGLLDQDLMDMGVTLGADIPYCIMGGTALSEGIGEVLTQLPPLPDCYFLVAKPPVSVSTGEAYGGYDRLISEFEEKLKNNLNESEMSFVQQITDFRTPIAEQRKEKLFNKFKNECINKINEMLKEDAENVELKGLSDQINEMSFNKETIVKDIAKLLEIRDILMDD